MHVGTHNGNQTKRSWRRAGTILAAVQLTAALMVGSACAQQKSWDEIVAAGRKEGALTIYTNYDPNQIPKIAAAFNKEYPEIKIDFLRPGPGPGQQRIEAEAQSKSYIADVFANADVGWAKGHVSDGLFAKLVGPNLKKPEVGKWLMGEDTFVLNYFTYYGYAWNTQLVSGTPTLKELMDSPDKYRGRVGLVDFSRGATFAVSLDLIADSYTLMYPGTTKADFYAKAKALEPRYYTSVVPIIQAIGSGELAFSPSIAPGFIAPNLPMAVGALKKPPAGSNYVAVPAGAPHPNAAQVYVNWCLSVAGQTVLAENQASVLPNIPTAKLSAPDLVQSDTSLYTKEQMDALIAGQGKALGK